MRRIVTMIFAVCAIALGSRAEAAEFIFSGTFKPANGASYTALLGSGSFDGYFTIAPSSFPASGTTTITAFSFNLRDNSGAILKTLTKGLDGASGFISSAYVGFYGGTVINFQDPAVNYLQLVVPTGFLGTGSVLANGYSYAQIAPQNQATVAAGMISAVPEPTTWAMMIFGFGLMGVAMRRRSRASSFA